MPVVDHIKGASDPHSPHPCFIQDIHVRVAVSGYNRAERKPVRVDARDDKEERASQPQPQILINIKVSRRRRRDRHQVSPPYSCTAVPPSFASCFGSSTLMDPCSEGLLIVENRHQEINKLMSCKLRNLLPMSYTLINSYPILVQFYQLHIRYMTVYVRSFMMVFLGSNFKRPR